MKKTKILIILLIVVLLCTGCITIREINELNFVLGTAFDYDPSTDLYTVYVQTPVTKPKGETEIGQPSWIIYQSEGRTVFEAIRKLAEQSPRRMYFAHCDVYMVGEEFAKKGLLPIIDFLQRDGETRVSTSHLILVKGSLKDIVTVKNGRESVPSNAIEKIMESAEKSFSLAPNVTVRDFIKEYFSSPSYSLAPVIGYEAPNVQAEEATRKFKAEGTGVFKSDKLIGTLDAIETRGYLMIANELQSAILVGELPDGAKKISFEVVSLESKLEPVVQDEQLMVNVDIKVASNLGELDGVIDINKPEVMDELEEIQKQVIETEVKMAINKAQSLKADIFDISDKLYKFQPEVWQQVEKDWENVFANLEFNVQVESTVNRTGRITDLGKTTS